MKRIVTGVLAAVLLGGCAAEAPVVVERRVNILSPSQEASLGHSQHRMVEHEFGGVYDNPRVQAYVDDVGRRLVPASEVPDAVFRFTVLDSPLPNALALPGGYVYVTRGLLALAENEAELASVLAHEIGHVNARHAGERISRAVIAELGLVAAAILGGDPQLASAAEAPVAAALQHYSREQEYEADVIGIRTLARAGYDPRAAGDFLARLHRHAAQKERRTGRPTGSVDEPDMLSTHPRTIDRVQRATQAALGHPQGGRLEAGRYRRMVLTAM